MRRLQPGKILLAQNGKDALDILERTKCDLVLTDIQMPVMDGLVMLRRMRAADRPWRKLPAVAVSAAATGNDRRAALSAGANAFLAKPVSPDALYEAVTRRMRD